MYSVALIGPDGSGKTTLARRLQRAFPDRVKYLYMGVNAESSNVKLPTTRLAEHVKKMLNQRSSRTRQKVHTQSGASSHGAVWSSLRLINRIIEETYRYALSWMYRKSGHIVIYDRYYKFDYACQSDQLTSMPVDERLHRRWLATVYPYPDLVIFLNAPPEVLFARKGEATLEWLAERQEAIIREGASLANFICVDASRPIEDVYAEVERYVIGLCCSATGPNGHARMTVDRSTPKAQVTDEQQTRSVRD